MASWRDLGDELDRWAEAGRRATLWWRDDDAAHATTALERLLTLRQRLDIPLALAAMPALIDDPAAKAIADDAGATVLQHGYAHHNHAMASERKAELSDSRDPNIVMDELVRGWQRLESLFGDRAVPVLVPPWNRIGYSLVPRLGNAGYCGLSTYGPRPRRLAGPGVVLVNTHIDLIDWRGHRSFVGDDNALELAVAHLTARRLNNNGDDEPTGLLSHHLAHDEACWDFIATLAAATRAHPAADWLDARTIFADTP
jgi:hypothetical protein